MSKLILIPTPIGNLDDITLRAIECIKDADLILCEDTRRSLKLMNHLEIKKPLKSFHKFNEHSTVEKIIFEAVLLFLSLMILYLYHQAPLS